jgi:hypothetical protein
MKKHYCTNTNIILCKQKHKNNILALSRFYYNIGETNNCKKCDRILTEYVNESLNKCVSFEELGYKTECQWRNNNKCNCIDDCNFKRSF